MTTTPIKKPVNYLNNKDILKEIHLSKNSYCSYTKPEYHQYDMIIDLTDNQNLHDSLAYICRDQTIKTAREARATREKIDEATISKTDLIFRVMTWDHIPVAPKQPRKSSKPKSAKEIFEFEDDEENLFEDLEDPELAKEMGMNDMVHIRVNFPPFQHYKFDDNNNLICVGKSHWRGDPESGEFSKDHGQVTPKLAKMYLMLCEKYAMRFNWRGYCVDETTEALTKRGWLGIDQITTDDTILSYDNGHLIWSSIESIYRGNYTGMVHQLSARGYDTVVTPEHKMVTDRGLIKVEYLKETDRLILLGKEVLDQKDSVYTDEFVELCGWILTEGCYEYDKNRNIKQISVYQNQGPKSDRIRNCLEKLEIKFSVRQRGRVQQYRIWKQDCVRFTSALPDKNFTMEFILDLTASQRHLLIDTMISGDGWRRGSGRSYVQKDRQHVDLFQILCALSGIRTNTHLRDSVSFGKPTSYYSINLYSTRNNVARVENIDFHGGKNSGREVIGQGKEHHPNIPTMPYDGRVWCPKTEYGCFVARRNDTIYLTGNTYVDEMKCSAILQLTYVGLRFNESKSQNPFAYYTAAINNSFRRVLNSEKRNQSLRDDILEMNNLQPSWTRQYANDGGHHDD